MLARLRDSRLFWPSMMTAIAVPILLALGTWQLQRKAWKEGLLADIAQRNSQMPVDPGHHMFASRPAERPAEYTRVVVTGRFLHDKERFWFTDGHQGSGFAVFTPLEMAPRQIVWVNRGYIPARLKDPATRLEGQLQDRTTVTGLIRSPGERNTFTPANDVAKNVWFWRDLAALNASAFAGDVQISPLMIDAAAEPANPGGWPKGGATAARLSNRHLEYAVTWYGLAATLIGVYLAYARGRLAASGKPEHIE